MHNSLVQIQAWFDHVRDLIPPLIFIASKSGRPLASINQSMYVFCQYLAVTRSIHAAWHYIYQRLCQPKFSSQDNFSQQTESEVQDDDPKHAAGGVLLRTIKTKTYTKSQHTKSQHTKSRNRRRREINFLDGSSHVQLHPLQPDRMPCTTNKSEQKPLNPQRQQFQGSRKCRTSLKESNLMHDTSASC